MIQNKNEELVTQDKMISQLWSDKLSGHQYLLNSTFRDMPQMSGFIDDLDRSIGVLRSLSYHSELTEEERNHILDFLHKGVIDFLGEKEHDVCETLQVDSLYQVFQGKDFEVVERLEKIINPNMITRCREYKPVVIYEKRDTWDFKEGDTIKLMIRLLSNYSLRSHEVELVAQENLELIDPYWGEFTYVVSDSSAELGRHRISFNTYDWISRDTVEEYVILMGQDFGE